MKNRLHRFDINRNRPRHGHNYSNAVWSYLYAIINNWAKFEVQFMKKLSNTEAELEKDIVYKKRVLSTTIAKNS